MMYNIDKTKVTFDPASVVDQVGKVFYYQNEVYRAINPGNEIIVKKEDPAEVGLFSPGEPYIKTPEKHSLSLNKYLEMYKSRFKI